MKGGQPVKTYLALLLSVLFMPVSLALAQAGSGDQAWQERVQSRYAIERAARFSEIDNVVLSSGRRFLIMPPLARKSRDGRVRMLPERACYGWRANFSIILLGKERWLSESRALQIFSEAEATLRSLCPTETQITLNFYFDEFMLSDSGGLMTPGVFDHNGRLEASAGEITRKGQQVSFRRGTLWPRSSMVSGEEPSLRLDRILQAAIPAEQAADEYEAQTRRNWAAFRAEIAERSVWFAAIQAQTGWPGADNYLLDLYLAGVPALAKPPKPRWVDSDRTIPADINKVIRGDSVRKWPERTVLIAFAERYSRECGRNSPNGSNTFRLSQTDGDGYQRAQASVHVDRLISAEYEQAKRAMGISFSLFELARVKEIQADMDPLFSDWECGGSGWQPFLRGLK